VIIKLTPPPRSPAPEGEIRVDYIRPGNLRGYHFNTETVKDGKVSLDVPVPPGRILYKPYRLVGYWFPTKSRVTVPAGDGPYVIDVPVRAAGAVYGRVLGADGKPASRANISVIIVKKPAGDPGHVLPHSVHPDARTGRFLITPLVLGGKYRIVARSSDIGDKATTISEVLTVNEDRPIQQADLRFVEGMTLDGTVRGPRGRPVHGGRVKLGWDSSSSHSFGSAPVMTDRHGRFRFRRVNTRLGGKYYLTVRPTAKLAGRRVHVKPADGPVTIKLEQGKALSGVVIEAKTGWPIPNAKVTASPSGYVKGGYGLGVGTRTDAQGRFGFSNLEPRGYWLRVDGAVAEGTIIKRFPDGRTSYRTPSGVGWPKIFGGRDASVTVRAKLKQYSALRPAEPAK